MVRSEPFMVFVSCVFGFGLLAGVWSGRHAHPGLGLLYCLVVTKTLVHAGSVVTEWHRFTMEPFLNILEAAGLIAIAGWVATRLRSPAVADAPKVAVGWQTAGAKGHAWA